MLLSYRDDLYEIPYKSTCILHTTGTIHNGDMVTITSPIFSSIDFLSKSINTSDRFEIPIHLNSDEIIINEDEKIKNALLFCNDNDPITMHVELL